MIEAPAPVRVAFTTLPDLASERVGGSVCACNDDYFAESANLVRATVPRFDPDAFTERGKWMDGWESQRRRSRHGGSCDHAIVTLGIPGEVVGVDVDTSHFLGNAPRTVELHAAELEPGADPEAAGVDWVALTPRSPVEPGTRNLFATEPAARGRRFTHVRLTIHPDGGVARLRVHGFGIPDASVFEQPEVDLAAAANGAIAVAASDQFFGGISNLILPGESSRMDEGWETRRTRDRVGDDWVVVRLARPGRVRRVQVDTSHFRGNAPDRCRLDGVLLGDRAARIDVGDDEAIEWRELVPFEPLGPHATHEFPADADAGVVDHVRLTIEPDGGIARLRVLGEPEVVR